VHCIVFPRHDGVGGSASGLGEIVQVRCGAMRDTILKSAFDALLFYAPGWLIGSFFLNVNICASRLPFHFLLLILFSLPFFSLLILVPLRSTPLYLNS
jgi:hypothetical protein